MSVWLKTEEINNIAMQAWKHRDTLEIRIYCYNSLVIALTLLKY